ncbi:MAG: hypothetical protein ABDI20_06320, partial [Candidatus Bipolaricaulaceae bacterium]
MTITFCLGIAVVLGFWGVAQPAVGPGPQGPFPPPPLDTLRPFYFTDAREDPGTIYKFDPMTLGLSRAYTRP